MDSREIAELTGKAHDKVIADIVKQLELVGDIAAFRGIYVDSMNRRQVHYRLPYRETMILVSGYSVELRARIIDRWMELEKATAPKVPKTYAEALQLAADQAKALEIAAPKVESFEALMRSDKMMSITDAAKHFGLHPKTQVFPYLRDRGYLTLADMPTKAAIDAGYLSLREAKAPNGKIYPQAVVEDCQLETWRLRVVPQIKAYHA
jgi:anti-repressor protein